MTIINVLLSFQSLDFENNDRQTFNSVVIEGLIRPGSRYSKSGIFYNVYSWDFLDIQAISTDLSNNYLILCL